MATGSARIAHIAMRTKGAPASAEVRFTMSGEGFHPFECVLIVEKALDAGEAERKARMMMRQFAKQLVASFESPT